MAGKKKKKSAWQIPGLPVTKVKELVSYYSKKMVLADLIYSKRHLCAFEVGIKMMDVSFVAILHKSPLEFPTRFSMNF